MAPMRILIALPVYEPALAELHRQEGIEIECIDPLYEPRTVAAESLVRADALFTSLPPTNFDACQNLRWVQIDSSGYNQLLPLNLPDRGIRASNAAGIFDVPIGEWCIAMMINLARDLRGMIRNQEKGIWDQDARHQMEVNGKTVGIWGYGGIGRHAARLAKSLGMNVSVLTRKPIEPRINRYHVPGTGDPEGELPDERFLMDHKDDFLARLDFLILGMPLTQVTEGIVGEHELRQLKPSAFILNPARGPLIQEQPLLRALREGWIAGAALDTHYHYPMPADHALWRLPSVIMTPHISGSSQSPHYLTRLWDILLENVSRWQNDRPLLNELSDSQLCGQ